MPCASAAPLTNLIRFVVASPRSLQPAAYENSLESLGKVRPVEVERGLPDRFDRMKSFLRSRVLPEFAVQLVALRERPAPQRERTLTPHGWSHAQLGIAPQG